MLIDTEKKDCSLHLSPNRHLHPYFMHVSSEASRESAHMHRLAWTFVVIWCDMTDISSTRLFLLSDKRASICALDNLDIPNGSYELKSGTSIVLYTCDRGFVLYGNEKLYCIASSWTSFPPKCISKYTYYCTQTQYGNISNIWSAYQLTSIFLVYFSF